MLAISDAVLVALIATAGSIVLGGIPLLTVLINRAVSKGTVAVSTLNTTEHLQNAAKLDALGTALSVHGTTLDRVEGTVLRQGEVLSEHLSWHLHAPPASVVNNVHPPKEAA